MGRELRRVPANWEHPRKDGYKKDYQPLYDQSFDIAAKDYREAFIEYYRAGQYKEENQEYWEYADNPPEREYYRAYKDEEATWYQVYETVSEGTPVTPPFATREELVEYLVINGDFWDQIRRREGISAIPCGPWERTAAYRFVFHSMSSPTFFVNNGVIKQGYEV